MPRPHCRDRGTLDAAPPNRRLLVCPSPVGVLLVSLASRQPPSSYPLSLTESSDSLLMGRPSLRKLITLPSRASVQPYSSKALPAYDASATDGDTAGISASACTGSNTQPLKNQRGVSNARAGPGAKASWEEAFPPVSGVPPAASPAPCPAGFYCTGLFSLLSAPHPPAHHAFLCLICS